VRERFTAVLLLAAAGCVAVSVTWVLRASPSRATEFARGDAPPSSRDIYLGDCATCHGANGRGTDRGPDLRGAGEGLVDYYLSTGRMPISSPNEKVRRHDPKYSPATIRRLVDYVQRLVGGDGPGIPHIDPAAGNVAEGETLYRLQCAACHAWSGRGGALLHREAPPVHPATPTQIAEAVRGGPGNMPAFGEAALTQSQLESLVRYVRYLDDPNDRGGTPLWHVGPLVEGAVGIFIGLGVLVLATRWIGTRT
jgi:ubiquinol-cytochrome c reductase cytochrome c subunit